MPRGGPGKPRRPRKPVSIEPAKLAKYERRISAYTREQAALEAHTYLTNVLLGTEEFDDGKVVAAKEIISWGWSKPVARTQNLDATRVIVALLERGISLTDALSDPAMCAFLEAMGVAVESLNRSLPVIIDAVGNERD